jgi:SurA N-terminal domain
MTTRAPIWLLVVGASLALCDCGAAKPHVVARVGGTTISRAALDHWTRIKAVEQQSPRGLSDGTRHRSAQRKALVFLITARWLEGEALAQGIDVPSSEVDATYRELASDRAGPSFATSLRNRGMSVADEKRLLRLQQLSNKLEAKITAGLGRAPSATRERRVAGFAAAYRQRWRLRTRCEPGYIVAECGNGPPLPGVPEAGLR